MKTSDTLQLMPLVVVVTPVYNGAAFLEAAMESVQKQNYPNILHIVFDNGSTDDTGNIIAKYLEKKIPVNVTRNKSVFPLQQSWNAAVNLVPSHASYFSILSADETISPDFIRLTIDVFERQPSVGVVGTLFHANTEPGTKGIWPTKHEVYPGKQAIYYQLTNHAKLPANVAVYRRNVLELRKPFFNLNLYAFDLDATMHILQFNDLGFVHTDLWMFCFRNDNITATEVLSKGRQHYELLYLFRKYGHSVMSKDQYRHWLKFYQRNCCLQLIKLRLNWSQKPYQDYVVSLETIGVPTPTIVQKTDALVYWILRRTKNIYQSILHLIIPQGGIR